MLPDDDLRPTPPPPPPPPPPARAALNYRAPRDEAPRNTPGLFFLRALAGLGIGVAAMVIGWFTAMSSRVPATFFLPIGIALAGTLAYSIRNRKFGYSTGILVAPVFLVGLGMILLLIICGTGGLRF